MRLIHTADWHLGRLFHNLHLTADQDYVLEQLVELAAEVRPAAVIVAGDLYDRAVPPTEAVELLDDVLTELVDRLGIPVVAIAGNHDSAGARRLRLAAAARARPAPRGRAAAGGLAHRPARRARSRPRQRSPLRRSRRGARRLRRPGHPRPAGGHRRRRGARARAPPSRTSATCSSRTPSSPAASRARASGRSASAAPQQVSAGTFAGFDYVALGHLHRPQRCGSDAVRYAGSLLKYSFAEHAHDKSVSVVDIGPRGSAPGEAGRAGRAAVTVETVPLSPRRDVRRVEGTLAELLAARPRRPAERRLRPRRAPRPRRSARPHRPAARRLSQHALHRAAAVRGDRRPGSSAAPGRAASAIWSSSARSSATRPATTSPPRSRPSSPRSSTRSTAAGREAGG